MKVQFWGTRGSIAKPGPSAERYGGNTSCVEIRSNNGTVVVLDCGTGSHALGQKLVAEGVKRGYLLIGHTHWDHIQGLPFFAPLFVPGTEWDIYGPKGLSGSLRQTLAGQMSSTYFPITIEQLGATIHYHDLLEGSFDLDDIHVSTRYLNHPALTLAYRLEADGASLVYACDHEPHSPTAAGGDEALHEQDLLHAEFASGVDLLIHDAQYTAEEYPAKVNWGHSTVEYAMRVARQSGVGRLALTHYDPLRTDDQVDQIVELAQESMRAAGSTIDVFAAHEGLEIDLAPRRRPALPDGPFVPPPDPSNGRVNAVLLDLADPDLSALFTSAASTAGIKIVHANDAEKAGSAIADARPSLAIFEHDPLRHDALELARTIRAKRAGDRRRLSVVVVADREYPGGDEAGVTEWLVTPFSSAYAQTKLQAWVLRGTSRWKKAPAPPDEERRLASLRALGVLDTEAEAPYERITHIASRVFHVPIALISLLDTEREWFKSSAGWHASETPRESSFTAHVVAEGRQLVVNDTLLDDRFADNPLVVNEPRIRFYAGSPITLNDGSCVGALCLIDTRPRWIDEPDLQLLEDLRDLTVVELERLVPH
jgi:ribonuclease BN (tRNA processing enzyme)/DNA-binding response OmpR family regulator